MKSKLYIVIVGCGRLGSRLANKLSKKNHSVVIVDIDEHAFSNLLLEYSGFRIEGDACELAVLKQAKLDLADLLIATTRDDNINLMVAQVARSEFGVSKVLARLFEPRREAIYQRMGIETICSTSIAVDLIMESISNEDL